MLRAIGVNFAQGYGIGKPQPFEDLLKRHSNIST
jgi:EAL domain-containing protein (putative c-di-GMP-specific phosphodiesterase class I)